MVGRLLEGDACRSRTLGGIHAPALGYWCAHVVDPVSVTTTEVWTASGASQLPKDGSLHGIVETGYAVHPHNCKRLTAFAFLVPVVLLLRPEPGVELLKTLRPQAARFDRSASFKRTAKLCFGLVVAVFLLQFYWVRELLFMETVVTVGFVIAALIGAVLVLGWIAVLWLRNLGSGLKAVGAHVSARYQQPFAKTTVIVLSDAKDEVF